MGYKKHKKNNLGIGSGALGCYNSLMPKGDKTKKESVAKRVDAIGGGKGSKAAAKADKKSRDDENDSSDSEVELEPVRPKIGESGDTLRKRAAWFQKRTGGS